MPKPLRRRATPRQSRSARPFGVALRPAPLTVRRWPDGTASHGAAGLADRSGTRRQIHPVLRENHSIDLAFRWTHPNADELIDFK